MISREDAKQYCLKLLNKEIEKHGKDCIFCMVPQPGKNTWTLAEAKKAVETDTNLWNGSNPIDDVLLYEKWLNERGRSLRGQLPMSL